VPALSDERAHARAQTFGEVRIALSRRKPASVRLAMDIVTDVTAHDTHYLV
jgi:hypothetical protein